jgi:hypothetical protein
MSNEWISVSRDDKKRVMRKGAGWRRRRPMTAASKDARYANSSIDDYVHDQKVMLSILSDCQRALASSRFHQRIFDVCGTSFAHSDTSPACLQIICYGIGNFSRTSSTNYSSSLWQLAEVLCLRQELQGKSAYSVPLYFYDPCSTNFEQVFLMERLQVEVLADNDRGRRAIEGNPTLFYMPHCPARLYENVLSANWEELHSETSTPLLILGNSLRNYCNPLYTLKFPCMKSLLPYTTEIRLDDKTLDDCKIAPGNIVGAFNDTYLTLFASVIKLGPQPTSSPERDDEDPELL